MIRIIERQGAEPKYHDSIVRMWTKERDLRFQCVGDAENDYSAARFDLLIEAETAAEMIWRGHKDITPQTICEYLRKKNALAVR